MSVDGNFIATAWWRDRGWWRWMDLFILFLLAVCLWMLARGQAPQIMFILSWGVWEVHVSRYERSVSCSTAPPSLAPPHSPSVSRTPLWQLREAAFDLEHSAWRTFILIFVDWSVLKCDSEEFWTEFWKARIFCQSSVFFHQLEFFWKQERKSVTSCITLDSSQKQKV